MAEKLKFDKNLDEAIAAGNAGDAAAVITGLEQAGDELRAMQMQQNTALPTFVYDFHAAAEDLRGKIGDLGPEVGQLLADFPKN